MSNLFSQFKQVDTSAKVESKLVKQFVDTLSLEEAKEAKAKLIYPYTFGNLREATKFPFKVRFIDERIGLADALFKPSNYKKLFTLDYDAIVFKIKSKFVCLYEGTNRNLRLNEGRIYLNIFKDKFHVIDTYDSFVAQNAYLVQVTYAINK